LTLGLGLPSGRPPGVYPVRVSLRKWGAARQRLLQRGLPDRLAPAIPAQQLLGSPGKHPSSLPSFAFDPGDHHRIVGGGLVPQPRNDGGFGPLFDRNSFRPGDGAAADRSSVERGRQPRGPAYRRNRRVWDERPETSPRLHRNPRRIRPGPYRSASRSARILSMVTAGAQTPLEKIFRPFFSCTIQCWQAALTLRVKAASPGWKQNPTLRCRQYLAIG